VSATSEKKKPSKGNNKAIQKLRNTQAIYTLYRFSSPKPFSIVASGIILLDTELSKEGIVVVGEVGHRVQAGQAAALLLTASGNTRKFRSGHVCC
jgi:hypothetical protein